MELQDAIYDKVVSSSNTNIYGDKCAKDQMANYDSAIMTYNDSHGRRQCHQMDHLPCRQLTQKISAPLNSITVSISTRIDGRLVSIAIDSVLYICPTGQIT